jgi:nicotinate-nucleotide adenylyltransferase
MGAGALGGDVSGRADAIARPMREGGPPIAPLTGPTGILGGTFDPIHFGHLAIGETVREALELDRVLFVPAAIPPHKPDRPIAPAHDRLAMVELAITGNPAFAASTIELDRAGPSFSVDTVEALAAATRGAGLEPDLWFILSVEAVRGLPDWREPERLLARCRLAVVPRAGEPALSDGWVERHFPQEADRFRLLDGPAIRVSASDVRRRAATGHSVRYLVPDAVAAYIGDHDLYRRSQT